MAIYELAKHMKTFWDDKKYFWIMMQHTAITVDLETSSLQNVLASLTERASGIFVERATEGYDVCDLHSVVDLPCQSRGESMSTV